MKKDYEVALSYAHDDKEIAEIIGRELEDVFANGFFMDVRRPEELANATVFEEKLQKIFQRTNYPIILYSENYCKGRFTVVEQEEILKRADDEEPHLFIINIDDCETSESFSENYSFILLKLSDLETEKLTLEEKIHNIIHHSIKRCMMKQSVKETKKQQEYSLNVQTLFTPGNDAKWMPDYDWTLSGRTYIGEDGRRIKAGTTWQKFWKYIEKDFSWLKGNLEADVKRTIRFNCHLSIAYKLGQIYGDLGQAPGNRNLTLVSSGKVKDIIFPFEKERRYVLPEDYNICREEEGTNPESGEIVCIVSIKPHEKNNILEDVKYYMEKQGKKYRRIYFFQKTMCIEDTATLESMAEYLRNSMSKPIVGDVKKIHLFPDTTAPLMFVLGARTIVPGEIQLYEYIPDENTYEMSLTR